MTKLHVESRGEILQRSCSAPGRIAVRAAWAVVFPMLVGVGCCPREPAIAAPAPIAPVSGPMPPPGMMISPTSGSGISTDEIVDEREPHGEAPPADDWGERLDLGSCEDREDRCCNLEAGCEEPVAGSVDKGGLEGPCGLLHPVHETLTLYSLRQTRSIPGSMPLHRLRDDEAHRAYIDGVIWNDDPTRLLERTSGRCSGASIYYGGSWLRQFRMAKRGGDNQSLLARSHFGDLQFLHAMAPADGITADKVQEQVLGWIEFCYAIATGALVGKTSMQDQKVPALVRERLGKAASTVDVLFGSAGPRALQQMAIGSMLHVIQDSFSPAHVSREGGTGKIECFFSYINQDSDKHGEEDVFKGSPSDPLPVRYPTGPKAVEVGATLIGYVQEKKPWAGIRQTLVEGAFALSKPRCKSGPGPFEKK